MKFQIYVSNYNFVIIPLRGSFMQRDAFFLFSRDILTLLAR